MGSHMKTTVEIADALLREAKAAAAREKTTVRALIEDGLRRVLTERRKRARFRLPKASFRGRGLHPDVEEGSWAAIRDRVYRGRGA